MSINSGGWSLDYDYVNGGNIWQKRFQNKGMGFQFSGPKMKSDRDMVLTVVKVNGICLRRAAEHLIDDEEVVLEAIK